MDIVEVISYYSEINNNNKTKCIFHDDSTASLVIYPHTESFYCFGCQAKGDAIDFVRGVEGLEFKEAVTKVSEILGQSYEETIKQMENKEGREDKPSVKITYMDKEEIDKFRKNKRYDSTGYRGIKEQYNRFFGHLTEYNDNGSVKARYYPETVDSKLTGYKCRNHPKDFSYGKVGYTGSQSQLSGQVKFKGGGKYVLYVAGEEDKVAAFQMLREHQIERGQEDYAPIPVVSPTTGEGGAAKQAAKEYDWFDSYENIIIGMDNDGPGLKAAREVAEILPKEKVKLVYWSNKDPNKMLEEGQSRQFIRDFYNAKDYISTGIKTSIDADKELEQELVRPKIPLPGFMAKLQKMMAGGIPLGYIINIIAKTGIGKTTVVNAAVEYWVYNSPYKVGVVSMELTSGQYAIEMLSRRVGNKISLIENPDDALAFVSSPEVMAARKDLFENEYGEPRWYLLDDREGTVQHIMKQCEVLHSKYGCKLIILDPLQDVLEGAAMDEQLQFMKWEKMMVKKGITLINICHTRKTGSNSTDKDGKRVQKELTEDDVHGISAIVKSGGANIIIDRDKYVDDEVKKNTTIAEMSKCRWTGRSGRCGEWYYDNSTHTLYDKEEYFKSRGTPKQF